MASADNVTEEIEATFERGIRVNNMIVDIHNLMYRILPSVDKEKSFKDDHEKAMFMVREIVSKLINLKKYYKCDIHVSWEGKDNFRFELFPEYKGNRDKTTEASLDVNLVKAKLREVLSYCDVTQWDGEKCEGDDIMGTLAYRLRGTSAIYSSDRDFLQLLFDNGTSRLVSCIPRKGKGDLIMTYNDHNKAFPFEPKDRIFIKSLEGDVGDNIKGAKGIGRNIAIELLKSYGDLKSLYNKVHEVPGKLHDETAAQYKKRLEELSFSESRIRVLKQYEDSVMLSNKLAVINTLAKIYELPKLTLEESLMDKYGWDFFICKDFFRIEDGIEESLHFETYGE